MADHEPPSVYGHGLLYMPLRWRLILGSDLVKARERLARTRMLQKKDRYPNRAAAEDQVVGISVVQE